MRISDWSSDVCSSDLKYTPRFSSTLALSWVLPVRPFDSEVAFNTDYYHTEKFGAQNGQNLPGYDLVNARLALNAIAGSGFSLAFGVRNLFNEKYSISPSNLLGTFPTTTVTEYSNTTCRETGCQSV